MSANYQESPQGYLVNLTLPAGAVDVDDEYGDLSVIQFGPNDDLSHNLRGFSSILPHANYEETGSENLSENADVLFSQSPPRSQGKAGKAERRAERTLSANSFLSILTRGWSKSATGSEVAKFKGNEQQQQSPTSVLKGKELGSVRVGSCEEEVEALKWKIFSCADGVDAQEFQDFLDEDDGDSTRIPVLCLVDYGGPGSYAMDMWVVMNNTIRRELFDAYEILNTIRQDYLCLTVRDIYEVRKWWRFFRLLWDEYEAYHREVLDPIMQRVCVVDGRREVLGPQLRALRDEREWLWLKMEETTSYIEEFETLRAGRALSLICKSVDSFAHRAMRAFAGQERLLPGLVEGYHGREVRAAAEEGLLQRMRGSERFSEMLVAVVRWMGTVQGYSGLRAQAREREKWLVARLHWRERQQLVKYFRKFEAGHGGVVRMFAAKREGERRREREKGRGQ